MNPNTPATGTRQLPSAPPYEACVIAASAGGVTALIELLGGLSAQLPLSVIVLLHTSAHAPELAGVLGTRCPLPVRTAQAGERVPHGEVRVAPPGYHLLVEHDRRFSLSIDDKVCYVRPSADVLFAAAADCWRERLVGVVLTGSNEDGAEGLHRIRSRMGLAIVQDPAEAEAPIMPKAALDRAGADHVMPLAAIAPFLNRLSGV